jgi:hypothetical protein
MKMRRLPEIDLARIAPLSTEDKYIALRRQKVANPPYSYDPFRSVLSDIFNAEYPLFGSSARTPWEKIEKKLQSRSKDTTEYAANVKLAKILHERAIGDGLIGQSQDFLPFPIGLDEKVKYWFRLSYVREGRLIVPFIDPRMQNSLGPNGRRFTFSMMNQAIREANPDFEAASFEIIHFGRAINGRTINVYSDTNVELYDFDELDNMVRETYAIWAAVLKEREKEDRRKSYGRRGSLI